jgi:hypothetical protein
MGFDWKYTYCHVLSVLDCFGLQVVHLSTVVSLTVMEPPKVLGPPTDVLVLRTLDIHAGARNDSASSVNCIFIISPNSVSPITQTLHTYSE